MTITISYSLLQGYWKPWASIFEVSSFIYIYSLYYILNFLRLRCSLLSLPSAWFENRSLFSTYIFCHVNTALSCKQSQSRSTSEAKQEIPIISSLRNKYFRYCLPNCLVYGESYVHFSFLKEIANICLHLPTDI